MRPCASRQGASFELVTSRAFFWGLSLNAGRSGAGFDTLRERRKALLSLVAQLGQPSVGLGRATLRCRGRPRTSSLLQRDAALHQGEHGALRRGRTTAQRPEADDERAGQEQSSGGASTWATSPNLYGSLTFSDAARERFAQRRV